MLVGHINIVEVYEIMIKYIKGINSLHEIKGNKIGKKNSAAMSVRN